MTPVSLCRFYNKIFRADRENDKSLKILLQIYLEKFTHLLQKNVSQNVSTSQNVSLIALLDSLVIITNERTIDANVSNKETEVFTLISHALPISEIFQILLVLKNY